MTCSDEQVVLISWGCGWPASFVIHIVARTITRRLRKYAIAVGLAHHLSLARVSEGTSPRIAHDRLCLCLARKRMIARGKRVQGELTKNPTMYYVEEGKPNELTRRRRRSAAEGLVANWDLSVHPTASREGPSRKVATRARKGTGKRARTWSKGKSWGMGMFTSRGAQRAPHRGHGLGKTAAASDLSEAPADHTIRV